MLLCQVLYTVESLPDHGTTLWSTNCICRNPGANFTIQAQNNLYSSAYEQYCLQMQEFPLKSTKNSNRFKDFKCHKYTLMLYWCIVQMFLQCCPLPSCFYKLLWNKLPKRKRGKTLIQQTLISSAHSAHVDSGFHFTKETESEMCLVHFHFCSPTQNILSV